VDVYGADPSAINRDVFARAVVLARAYVASPAAMTVESDDSPTVSVTGHHDPADVGPAVKALLEIIQDIEPDDGEPPIALLTECLAAAARAATTNTPWALMRVYGSRIATALATVEGRGDDVAKSMSLAAGRVAAESRTQGTSARDAFARSIAAVIDAIGLVTSAQEAQQGALSSLLVRALGLAAVATAAVRVDERLKG
jgi:hypothetical protein